MAFGWSFFFLTVKILRVRHASDISMVDLVQACGCEGGKWPELCEQHEGQTMKERRLNSARVSEFFNWDLSLQMISVGGKMKLVGRGDNEYASSDSDDGDEQCHHCSVVLPRQTSVPQMNENAELVRRIQELQDELDRLRPLASSNEDELKVLQADLDELRGVCAMLRSKESESAIETDSLKFHNDSLKAELEDLKLKFRDEQQRRKSTIDLLKLEHQEQLNAAQLAAERNSAAEWKEMEASWQRRESELLKERQALPIRISIC